MLFRYTFYGGIRRLLTRLDPSKQFGPHATMAPTAAPTPWYHPPPFVDNITWWDHSFLKFPHLPTPNKPDLDPNHLDLLKTHCPEYFPLVSTSKIFFGCNHILCIFSASSNKTLKLSLFLHPHSTDFHHFYLANEDHDKQIEMTTMEAFCRSPCPKSIGNNQMLS
jgi:hypothetical protein